MLVCDLNCDMGEGLDNEHLIMPFISSANIACGFHAGSSDTMRRCIELAIQNKVKIGAHPGFKDKENFGRKEMRLNADKLYAIVLEQLIRLDLIAKEKGAALYHVKPHGALYNLAARDRQTARVIATAVKDFNEHLVLYGLSKSVLIEEGQLAGLLTANEVFADRSYQDDGSLTPRTQGNAILKSEETILNQVKQIIRYGTVTTVSGKTIPLKAETICIHGDHHRAVFLARSIYNTLQKENLAGKTTQV